MKNKLLKSLTSILLSILLIVVMIPNASFYEVYAAASKMTITKETKPEGNLQPGKGYPVN